MNIHLPQRRIRRGATGNLLAAASLACASVVVAVTPLRAAAAACTDSWTGADDSSWFTPGNWTDGVPDGSQDVCIGDIITGTYTVTVDGATGTATAGSLTVGGASGTQTVVLDSGVLSIGADSTISANGALVLEGSSEAAVVLQGFVLSNAGTVSVLAGGAREIGGGPVVNTGTLTIDADTNTLPYFATPMTLDNQGAVSIGNGVTVSAPTVTNTSGTISDNGHLVVSDFTQGAGATSPNPIEFAGGGTFHRNGAGAVQVLVPDSKQLTFDGSVLGSGQTVDLVGAQMFLSSDLTNNSTIVLEGSSEAALVLQGFVLSNAGTVSVLAGGAREIGGGTVVNTGTLTIDEDTNTLPYFTTPMTFTQPRVGTLHVTIDASGSAGHLVTASADLAGTLAATTVGLPVGDFDVVTGGSINGRFSTLDYGSTLYSAAYSGSTVTLSRPGNYQYGDLQLSSHVAAATGVTYTIGSEGPALTSGSSTLVLTASAGTVFPTTSGCGVYTITDTTTSASSACPIVTGGGGAGVTVTAPFSTAARDHVVLSINGVTNTSPNGSYELTVANGANQLPLGFVLDGSAAPAITSPNQATFTIGALGTFNVIATGGPLPALSVSAGLPAWASFVDHGNGTATLSGTPPAGSAGPFPLTLTAANGVMPNATQNFTLTVDEAPAITSTNNATFTVGTLGTFTATATGAPTPTWSSTGTLPSGVTFNTGTHTLSGTPAAGTGGTYSISITASNGVAPDATQPFTLTVNQAPSITSATSSTFTVGTFGSFTTVGSGFPTALTWSLTGTLPSGVTFNTGTHTLSGTPAAGTAGAYPVTITAANGVAPNATQSFTLNVSAANQAPIITSANATTFTVGTAGSFTTTATGVPTPTWSSIGTLPSGVTFNTSTHVLSGTPAAGSGGTYGITITASNGVAPNATQSFTLTVNEAPVITSASSTTFTVGAPGSFTTAGSGFPTALTWSLTGTLPTGVTFNTGTHTLSGTPAAGTSGAYPVTITAANGVAPNATQSFTLNVSAVATQAPIITSTNATTFTVGAVGSFTTTATGVPTPTWSLTGTLPSGVTFNTGTHTLSGTPAAGTGGTYSISITASNGVAPDAVQTFTLTVNQAPAITSANGTTFTVGTPGSFTTTGSGFPTALTWSSTGTLPTGVTFNTGTHTLSGTPAAGTGGTYSITLTASNGIAPNATQPFTLTVNQAPAITSASNTTFTVGTPGSFTTVGSGFPTALTWSLTGTLPTGVTFNTGTHILSGTPAAGTAGAYPVTITAANGVAPNATQSFTLNVSAANQAPIITSANATTFTVGAVGSFTTTATGVPTPTWSSTGTLPSGVTFNTATHVLSGTPAAGTGGTYGITITASNGVAPNATQSFTLTVNQAPVITSANATTFTVGTPGSFTTAGSGFPTALTWSLTGTLPAGVTFNAGTHTLSGTPAAGTSGAYPVTITAANGVAPNATQNFTLNVSPATPASADLRLQVTQPASMLLGDGFAVSLAVTNFGPSAASAVSAVVTVDQNLVVGVLPAGCTQSAVAAGTKVTCALGTVAATGLALPSILIPVRSRVIGGSVTCTNWGTSGADTLTGTAGADVICGLGGNDTIDGLDGFDTVYGDTPPGATGYTAGATGSVSSTTSDPVPTNNGSSASTTVSLSAGGADTIAGGAGADTLYGEEGADTIYGDVASPSGTYAGTGVADTIDGGVGDDTILGQGGDDTLFGGLGNDTLYGQDGSDTLYGQDGNDIVSGNAGSDTLYGNAGADTIYGDVTSPAGEYAGSGAADTIDGGAGNDTILGQGGDDTIEGGADVDTIYGQDGADQISGGLGSDTIEGNAGGDTIYGDVMSSAAQHAGSGAGDDINGGAGDDIIFGQGGDDTIEGSLNGDTIYGQDGADQISGGLGADTIEGNAGADTIYGDVMSAAGQYAGTGAGDTIDGGSGADKILGQGGGDALSGGAGDDDMYGQDGDDTMVGNGDDDHLYGNDGADTLEGASGNDILEGDAGNDRLDGGTLTPDPAHPTRIVQKLDCGAGTADHYSNGPIGESHRNCEIVG